MILNGSMHQQTPMSLRTYWLFVLRIWKYSLYKSLNDLLNWLLNFVQSKYVGHSISFQTFFVQAFKIVVDSWKSNMLLLYILWEGWPIFRILASNKQLQQQLEYTLLKPDCHRWWISKMQSGCEDTLEEWYAIRFCFKLGKYAMDMYGMLQTTFGASCLNRASVFEWHKRFKEGTESVRDDERCGRSNKVNRPEMIGQTVRVRVTMLRFYGSSGRDS